MSAFTDFKINNMLLRALSDLGFDTPTPIQQQAFPVVMSGTDVVGIAQTGTGKTFTMISPVGKFHKDLEPTEVTEPDDLWGIFPRTCL